VRLAVLLLLIAPLTAVAAAQESFDGAWRGVITCAPHAEDGGARGYSYGFPAQVKNGVFHAERKAEDAPGSLQIDGPIQPDGTAELIAKGLTGHPDNAVRHLTPATPYTYRIKARFEGSKGVGTRLDVRKCDFTFTEQ
jgi:hypothetical protein